MSNIVSVLWGMFKTIFSIIAPFFVFFGIVFAICFILISIKDLFISDNKTNKVPQKPIDTKDISLNYKTVMDDKPIDIDIKNSANDDILDKALNGNRIKKL